MAAGRQRAASPRKSLQSVWCTIKQRCLQQDHANYPYYGGRGIKICSEWLGSGSSEAFVQWALANGYAPGLQIDRINTNGDYTPDNCRFVTPKQNARNYRYNVYAELNGERVQVVAALESVNPTYTEIDLSRVLKRVHRGWSLEKAITTPKLGR